MNEIVRPGSPRLLWFVGALSLAVVVLTSSCKGSGNKSEENDYHYLYGYHDGPYLIYDGGQARFLSVKPSVNGPDIVNRYVKLSDLEKELFTVYPDSKSENGKYMEPFQVSLYPFETEDQWAFRQPGKIFALSDIECHFSEYVHILQAGGVIDDKYNWIYGDGHLVVNGDLFNRGHDLIALFWLTYRMEYQAAKAGGKVHVIPGNHEEMALRGDVRYTVERYLNFSEQVGIPYQDMFGTNSELGRWLRSKNSIITIGNTLFVHGGISLEFLEREITIADANSIVRENLGKNRSELEGTADFLFRTSGIFWYRGMVFTEEDRLPLNMEETAIVLDYFGVDRIVVGHCKGPDIAKARGDMVIAIDVNHINNRKNGVSRALLIMKDDTGESLWKVNDKGDLQEITEM